MSTSTRLTELSLAGFGTPRSFTPTSLFSCAICSSRSARTCGTCNSTAYCNKTCQQADWPCHKLVCSRLAKSPTDVARPIKNCVRAILLPADGDEPVFVYFSTDNGGNEGLYDLVDRLFAEHENPNNIEPAHKNEEEMDTGYTLTPLDYVDVNKVRNYRRTENLLQIWHKESVGSNVNQAILKATNGPGRYHLWRGSVLIVAMASRTPAKGEKQVFKDLSLRDFRDAVDWLADFGNPHRRQDELTTSMEWNAVPKAKEDLLDQNELLKNYGGMEIEEMSDAAWAAHLTDYMSL